MMNQKFKQSTLKLITSASLALGVVSLPAFADNVVPSQLPLPTDEAPAKDQPVKIYILSGQSNSLGFGRVTPGATHIDSVYMSPDPRVKTGPMPVGGSSIMPMHVFTDEAGSTPGAIAHVAGNTQPFALGHADAAVPHKAGEPTTVKAFIETGFTGAHQVYVGYEESSVATASVAGQEVYTKTAGGQRTLTPIDLKAGQRYPLTITYHNPGDAGSASFYMEYVGLEPKGDLETLVKKEGRFPGLLSKDGSWVARPDVMINDAYMGKGKSQPLSPTWRGSFGPELGFGFVMGTFHDEPVIVMKADIGNRSLAWDILPPGSERYEVDGRMYAGYGDTESSWPKEQGEPKPGGWYAGKQYDEYTAAIRRELDGFAEKYPEYADQGFEVAGFVWWQGHKDQNPVHASRYAQNLANLIKAWRKEFDAPDAKFVVATIAFGGWDLDGAGLQVAEAQLSVDGDTGKFPEFKGNVKTVEARDFWRGISESPRNQDYHYNHNAETYFLVGDALGRAMVELEGGTAEPRIVPERPEPFGRLPDSATLAQHAQMLLSDPFLSRWSKHPDKPTSEDYAAMQPVLEPIIMGNLMPELVSDFHDRPAHRRGGTAMNRLVTGEAPRRLPKALGTQYDEVIALYRAAGVEKYGWEPMKPGMQLAEWNYITFDPPEAYEKGKSNRNREITVPQGSEGWNQPGFDPTRAGWKTGQAPFGQNDGKQAALRNCNHPHCGCGITPNTLWDKEVLLMQQTFEVPQLKEGYAYRLVRGGMAHSWSGEGYTIWIDGRKVAHTDGGNYKGNHAPAGGHIWNEHKAAFEDGKVTIAVKAFLRYTGHRNKPAPPRGHISVWLEEVELPQLVIDTAEAVVAAEAKE